MVLVVNPNRIAATSGRDFFAHLKSRPGEVNYGSGGNGTILHLATELVLEAAGTSAKHIPYKGVGPMVADLLGGQIEFATVALPSVQGQLRGGTLRAIGMLSPQRTPAAPEVPTFAEQGLANFSVEAWFAVIGPKNLNAANVRRAHEAVVAAFRDPAVMEAMAKQGNTINVSTPEQAQTAFQVELAKYAALVKKVGLQAQ
jgi:tripartite-type tricarboxylate transporter receptor subunit TctC